MDSQDYSYYANILQDEPPAHTPAETVSESNTKKAQRTRNFTVEEDTLLVSAWLNISQDAVQGNDQNRKTYWSRVTEFFHEFKTFTSDRTSNSLMNRWSTIQLAVNKYCGFYAQIEMRNQSGITEQDKIFQAKQMYQSIEKSPFQYLHCWHELRYQPKWLDTKQKKKSKKCKNASPGASSPSTPDSINLEADNDSSDILSNFDRPPGRKAAKELLKRKKNKEQVSDGTGKSVAVILEEFASYKKEIDRIKIELCQKSCLQDEQRLVIDQEKIRMEQHREEERIMLIDTASMPPHLAEYYKFRQMEIIEARKH